MDLQIFNPDVFGRAFKTVQDRGKIRDSEWTT